MFNHETVVAESARLGFTPSEEGTWELRPEGTGRGVFLRISGIETARRYAIEIEEFRGGEGTEDEVLATTSAPEVVAALTRWAAWAEEPFDRPRGWWARLRAYLGG